MSAVVAADELEAGVSGEPRTADASISDANTEADVGGDAATDSGDGGEDGSIGCTVVDPGAPHGIICNSTPMILSCDSPVAPETCSSVCAPHVAPYNVSNCSVSDSGLELRCAYGCGGRRPAGFAGGSCDALRSIGGFFANLAELEAASVDAFEILRDELVAHGAPSELVCAAQRAAEDEIRHAKIVGALARRHGANPARRKIERAPIRDLETIAVENAREGCARETFGALVAMHQAHAARDPIVRRVMRRIAEDETDHAALAWRVAVWASSKLDDRGRMRVSDAAMEAFSGLAREAALEPARELQAMAGMPSARIATRMVEALRDFTAANGTTADGYGLVTY